MFLFCVHDQFSSLTSISISVEMNEEMLFIKIQISGFYNFPLLNLFFIQNNPKTRPGWQVKMTIYRN